MAKARAVGEVVGEARAVANMGEVVGPLGAVASMEAKGMPNMGEVVGPLEARGMANMGEVMEARGQTRLEEVAGMETPLLRASGLGPGGTSGEKNKKQGRRLMGDPSINCRPTVSCKSPS